MKQKKVYKLNCSFCNSSNIHLIMDFGNMALAGGFLKPKSFNQEPKFKMRMCFCNECYGVQIIDSIPPDLMFKEYFYFSSAIRTLKEHFEVYAEELTERFLDPKNSSVLEFGCNDGVLLKPLAEQGIKNVIGVDPAENVVTTIKDKRITTICNYFNTDTAKSVLERFGRMDLVMANNVFAHIKDIRGTTEAVERVLDDEGVFVFEVHYLGEVIDNLQYDMIYHEHIYYYSLLSAIEHFTNFNMVIFDIKPIDIHGGSMRFYACKKNSSHASKISDAVKALITEETRKGYDKFETFNRFSDRVHGAKDDLLELLQTIKSQGYTIAGYGASGRANTIIQFCKINHNLLDYMIDDSPAKIGYYTPGSHFEIKSSEILESSECPDYVLVFAWSFFEEIKAKNDRFIKNGGKFILPLPEVRIY